MQTRPWTIAALIIGLVIIAVTFLIYRASTRRILSVSLIPHTDAPQARTVKFAISNAWSRSVRLFYCTAEMSSGNYAPNFLDSAESVRVIATAGIAGSLLPGESYVYHALTPERGRYWRLHVSYETKSWLQPVLDWCRAKAQAQAPWMLMAIPGSVRTNSSTSLWILDPDRPPNKTGCTEPRDRAAVACRASLPRGR
jgi:hypothetical protein